jgi:hypothetical protein
MLQSGERVDHSCSTSSGSADADLNPSAVAGSFFLGWSGNTAH